MGGNRNSYGKITKCINARVYIRPTIQSKVVGIVERGTEVMILGDPEQDPFFCKIITASGLRGYCMRVFVDIIHRSKPKPAEDN